VQTDYFAPPWTPIQTDGYVIRDSTSSTIQPKENDWKLVRLEQTGESEFILEALFPQNCPPSTEASVYMALPESTKLDVSFDPKEELRDITDRFVCMSHFYCHFSLVLTRSISLLARGFSVDVPVPVKSVALLDVKKSRSLRLLSIEYKGPKLLRLVRVHKWSVNAHNSFTVVSLTANCTPLQKLATAIWNQAYYRLPGK